MRPPWAPAGLPWWPAASLALPNCSTLSFSPHPGDPSKTLKRTFAQRKANSEHSLRAPVSPKAPQWTGLSRQQGPGSGTHRPRGLPGPEAVPMCQPGRGAPLQCRGDGGHPDAPVCTVASPSWPHWPFPGLSCLSGGLCLHGSTASS